MKLRKMINPENSQKFDEKRDDFIRLAFLVIQLRGALILRVVVLLESALSSPKL